MIGLCREYLPVQCIQATIECRFTLKRVRDMIRTYSQMPLSQMSSLTLKLISTLHLGETVTKMVVEK